MSPLELWLPVRPAGAGRSPSLSPSSGLNSRIEVCPPRHWPSSLTLWGRMQRWLMRSPALRRARSGAADRLALVKREFAEAVGDLDEGAAVRLAHKIGRARSLRELWHLRSELYDRLAIGFSQSVAEDRLAALNRHFPTRMPRSVDH